MASECGAKSRGKVAARQVARARGAATGVKYWIPRCRGDLCPGVGPGSVEDREHARECWDSGAYRVRGDIFSTGDASITIGVFNGWVSGILLQIDLRAVQAGSEAKAFAISPSWEEKAREFHRVALGERVRC